MKEIVKLAPPNVTHAAMLKAFFKSSPGVKVGNIKNDTVTIRVTDAKKAYALEQILEHDLGWGGKRLSVVVVPANKSALKLADGSHDWTGAELVETALDGNDFFVDVMKRKTPLGMVAFAVMGTFPVQFANDNIGSPWKLTTMTAEDVCRRIFRGTGVSFCTAKD